MDNKSDAEKYRLLQAEAMLNTYRRYLHSCGEEESMEGLARFMLEFSPGKPTEIVKHKNEWIIKGLEERFQ